MNRPTILRPTIAGASEQRGNRAPGGQVAMLVGLAIALTLAVIFFSTVYYGGVVGQEFSPDNFTRREFRYYEIPLLGLQVFPIDRQDKTSDLERFLIGQKLVAEWKSTDALRRWDLVQAARGTARSAPFSRGDASILCSYLDTRDASGNLVWLEWSRKHSSVAAVVWPLVAKVARQELYFFVPDLLTAARGATDPAGLRQQLNAILAGQYSELARVQQQLARHERAVELYTEAIAHAPRLSPAYSGRAQSLSALGQRRRASEDLTQARSLEQP